MSILIGLFIGKHNKSRKIFNTDTPIIPMIENPCFVYNTDVNETTLEYNNKNINSKDNINIIQNSNYESLNNNYQTLTPNHQIYHESDCDLIYEIPIPCDGYYNENSNINKEEENIYSVVGDANTDQKEEYGFGYLDISDNDNL